MATHDDPHNDRHVDRRFGPSGWPPILQFIWGLLFDLRRIATLVAALLIFRLAYASVFYDLTQDVRHSVVASLLTGSISLTLAGHGVAKRVRKARRKRLAEKRAPAEPVEGAPAQPVQKPPGQNGDDGLGGPGED
jgi:hypothetical protein